MNERLEKLKELRKELEQYIDTAYTFDSDVKRAISQKQNIDAEILNIKYQELIKTE